MIGSASIIFPLPHFLIIIAAGKILDPLLVGLISGVGSAIGELTSYGLAFGIVFGGRKIRKRKKSKHEKRLLKKIDMAFKNRWGFPFIFIFAVTPLPFDLIGLYCGAVGYDVKKFFLATLIGKIIISLILAYSGFYGIDLVMAYL